MSEKEFKLNTVFMKTAMLISELSHCISHKVGAVLVRDNRIISTGYNGTPAGYINCDDYFSLNIKDKNNLTDIERKHHHDFSEIFEIHAELNAILCAAKNGLSTDGCTLYSTLQPCNNCLKMICNTGIKTIYYNKPYDKSSMNDSVLEMLKNCNISLIHFPVD